MLTKIMLIIPLTIFLSIDELLGKHAPLKKLSKYQSKLKTKPCITSAIHKSILVKNSLFKKCMKLRDPVKKTETHHKCKNYKNFPATVIKNEFFKNNMDNIIKLVKEPEI